MPQETETQKKHYEYLKKCKTHVFVKAHFPYYAGEFIGLDGLKEDFKKELIENKSIAELIYL